jgi:hypothetical protein
MGANEKLPGVDATGMVRVWVVTISARWGFVHGASRQDAI